ncbi:heparan-alpha-glucosaminide N-acetyltransferase domain-containing protein [Flavobacterium columnare]|uniref:heparan-alpha-glucosaminide N-acetyltransferase domain-containing protein n=1 Tax=Flavobacterium columnare TaxID=996 RepID=UPI001474C3A7|nr:heparan-alpha-glucosaminide N-acetyltransferase domain-containing protein [Flavobacterium columnare]
MTNNRIAAIDFTRGISVFFLVIVHTMLIYGTLETQTKTTIGQIIIWLGRGGAMYLIAMGISFTFSRRQSFYAVIKRGLYILFIGYSLNFVKFIIPEFLFGGLPHRFLNAYHLKTQTLETTLFFLELGDILQLAGISLLLIACINQITNNKWIYFLLGLLIIVVSKELSGFKINILGIQYICDLFFSNQYNVYFPVFPWSAFIFLDVLLGKQLKEIHNNTQIFFKNLALQSLGLIILGLLLVFSNYKYHFGNYYHLGPGGSIILLGTMMLSFWISNQLIKLFNPNSKFFRSIIYLSKNTTSIYFIQWTLINWGMYVFGFWSFDQWNVLVLIVLFTVLTLLTNILYRKLQSLRIIQLKK